MFPHPPTPLPRPGQRQGWFKQLLSLRGSVIPAVLPRTLLCMVFAGVIYGLHQRQWPVSVPILGTLVPSLVLGLLLVFRTNTSYERFWEGRKLWGNVITLSRNLTRHIWVAIAAPHPADHQAKVDAIHLLPAFAVAMKLHLRGQGPNPELASLMTAPQFARLQTLQNPPLQIALWLAEYLQEQQTAGRLHPYQLTTCMESLDGLVSSLGGCERILKTPMPLAYSIHLKQLLMLYCLALPFQMVASVGWITPLLVGLISFAVFGIEEIGIEIENPFGDDANDLPLDAICRTMAQNIEDLLAMPPP